MAWPFSKSKQKLPGPPKPKLRKVVKVLGGQKDIAKLAKNLDSLNKDFDILRKEVDTEFKTINKDFAPILDTNAKQEEEIKELRISIQKLAKSIESVRKTVESLHAEMHDELKPVSKNLAAVLDKNAEQDKRISDLTATHNKIFNTIDSFERTISGMKEIIRDVESTFSAQALDSLSRNLKEFGKTLNKMEEDDDEIVKNLSKVDRRISAVEKKAMEVEAAHQEARDTALELARHAEDFKQVINTHTENMVAMSSKVNASLNQYSDIEQTTADLQNRMQALEAQMQSLCQNAQILSELVKKVDCLEKTTSKTIIVD